ncbi:MAG: carboxymuconolactone decarboxylase family protein [Gammaproteobacteria bacterium]|nr:carboxymuconolactone decarboxylase family protein [Gammaproteobacteria bacterium]MDH3511363.1 carboxymuconolactone decarboxylase family protein [Gammaproteobacteria bacterium]
MNNQSNQESPTRACCSALAPDEAQRMVTVSSSDAPKLEDLIPIAVVIAAGCEPCAQRAVAKALNDGSSARHIRKVLAIVAHMQQLQGLVHQVGPQVIARMNRPLEMAKRTLADTASAAGQARHEQGAGQ